VNGKRWQTSFTVCAVCVVDFGWPIWRGIQGEGVSGDAVGFGLAAAGLENPTHGRIHMQPRESPVTKWKRNTAERNYVAGLSRLMTKDRRMRRFWLGERVRWCDGKNRSIAEALEDRRLLSAGYVYKALADFASSGGGSSPAGQLGMDKSGDLFGFTSAGGTNSAGIAYEVQPGNGTPITLASFPAVSGAALTGPVIDSQGDLFGLSSTGGDATGDGTIFEIVKGSNAVTTVATFNSATTGSSPGGVLIIDSAGDLFGTTANGGANGCGTVWELAAGSTTIATLASFSPVSVNGANQNPGANSIVLDNNGNLFGTTEGNAAAGSFGTVWELPNGTAAIQTVATFNGTDGSTPVGRIAVDSKGNLYGSTQYGGDDIAGTSTPLGSGVVWELPVGITQPVVLADFDSTTVGEFPVGGVAPDDSGNLFGTTTIGGDLAATAAGDGTVWEVPARTVSPRTIEAFSGTNGSDPQGALITDNFGNVYGTTTAGGPGQGGSVFEMDLGGATQSASGLTTSVVRTTLPSGVPAGVASHGSVSIAVADSATPVKAKFTFRIYASADGAIDSRAVLIGSLTRTVQAGKNKTITVSAPVQFKAQTQGSYTILAQAVDPSGGASAVGTGPVVNVAAPFISLSESLVRSTVPATVAAGEKIHAQVTLKISNSGNVTASGPATIALEAMNASGSVTITSMVRRLGIAAGHSAIVSIPITSIPAAAAGDETLLAQVTDPKGGATGASLGTITVT
jgi:uncharacterized repeat protein (TIGR03803 family)